MFRGGRLGGIQGAAGAAYSAAHNREYDEILKTSSSLKRSKTASTLQAVSNSPKWIKLDGIHQKYVKRARLENVSWILSTRGSLFIGLAITIQSLVMGLELQLELDMNATLHEQGGPAFVTLLVVDCILLLIFLLEYILRSKALKWSYICSLLGLLDLLLLFSGGGYIIVVQLASVRIGGAWVRVVSSFRLLRILRVVHLLQILPALALLVKGLVSTILTIMDAMILLAILSYIGALICSEVLGKKDPEIESFFGSVPLSFLTHIKLVLVEGWPEISDAMLSDSKFWAAYLVVFILLSNFALLNLVTGVVCERVMELARQLPPKSHEEREFEFEMLKEEVAMLYENTPKQKPGYLLRHEYIKLFKSVLASDILERLKVTLPSEDLSLQYLLDEDANGKVTCTELQEGLLRLRSNRFDEVSRATQCTVRMCAGKRIRHLDQAFGDLRQGFRKDFRRCAQEVYKAMGQIEQDLPSHIEEEASLRRSQKVKKQQNDLLEATCAMKSLKYAISSLQKACSDAFTPSCGALTCYNGQEMRTSSATQTELDSE